MFTPPDTGNSNFSSFGDFGSYLTQLLGLKNNPSNIVDQQQQAQQAQGGNPLHGPQKIPAAPLGVNNPMQQTPGANSPPIGANPSPVGTSPVGANTPDMSNPSAQTLPPADAKTGLPPGGFASATGIAPAWKNPDLVNANNDGMMKQRMAQALISHPQPPMPGITTTHAPIQGNIPLAPAVGSLQQPNAQMGGKPGVGFSWRKRNNGGGGTY